MVEKSSDLFQDKIHLILRLFPITDLKETFTLLKKIKIVKKKKTDKALRVGEIEFISESSIQLP